MDNKWKSKHTSSCRNDCLRENAFLTSKIYLSIFFLEEIFNRYTMYYFYIKNLKKKAQKFPTSNTAFASILIPILLIKF